MTSNKLISRNGLFLFNMFIKGMNVFLILIPVFFADLPQFQGKAIGARLILYPAAGLIVPVIWWLFSKKSPFPHLVDILVVLPFIIDSGGNALNLYNTTEFYDRFAHWFNWMSLTVAFGSAVSICKITRVNVASLAIGFGAVTHILWEVGEFVVMQMGASGLQLTYTDTLEDLILSFFGTVIGSLLVVSVFWRAKLMPSSPAEHST